MSRRREQFNSALQRALSHVLTTRLNDPRITGMITVTRAEVSPDFHHARVGISVMPEEHEQRTLGGLRHAARHIQSMLYKEIRTRTIPQLHFELDRSLKKQSQVLDTIRRAVASDEARAAASRSDADDEGDTSAEAETEPDTDPSGPPPDSPSDSSPPAPEDPS